MRCMHHVFLRGGLALLLLACGSAGALSLSATTCHPALQAGAATTTAARTHC